MERQRTVGVKENSGVYSGGGHSYLVGAVVTAATGVKKF